MGETTGEHRNGTGTGSVGEWLPLREAAERLGVSLDSVRRRQRANTLRARQEPILGGHRWLVWVEAGARLADAPEDANGVAPPPSPGGANGVAHPANPQADGAGAEAPPPPRAPERPDTPEGGAPQASSGALVATQRAEEMARYTAALLEPWRRRVEELSRENGRLEERAEHLQERADGLQAELEQTRAQLAEATAPEAPAPERAPSPEQGNRRWWQRLLWE